MQASNITAPVENTTMAEVRTIVQRAAMRYLAAALAGAPLCPMPAGACPDLAGSYLCDDGGATYLVHLTQEDQSGNTTYTVDGSGDLRLSFVADGEVHETDDIDLVRSSTLRGWCEGNDLKVERHGILVDPDDGEEVGNLVLTYAMHLDGDVLIYGTTGFAKVEGHEVPTDETVRCQRKHD